jgi:hypothetical protein
MAAFIDTTHHFNLQNLVSILSHLDAEVSPDDLDMNSNGNERHTSVSPSPKLISYLQRLFVIKCCDADDFLMNFRPLPHKSQIEKLLLLNNVVSLLLIDSIDAFSHISQDSAEENQNILQLVKNSVKDTSTPVICTRNFSDDFTTATQGQTPRSNSKPQTPSPFSNQIYVDDDLFTRTLSLVPLASQPLTPGQLGYKPYAQRCLHEEVNGVYNENLRTESVAHLRSKSKQGNPNPSAIGGIRNHRVKFSIFSGMLWVCEDKGLGK